MSTISLLLAVTAGGSTRDASAAPITVEYSGAINHVIDADSVLDPSIQLGVPFFGSFTYDTEGAVDLTPDEPEVGTYSFPFSLYLHVGNTTIETTPVLMEVRDDGGSSGADELLVGQVSFEAAELSIVGLLLTFTSHTNELFSGTEPPNQWGLDSFPIPRMVLVANDFSVDLGGVISTLAATPEPSGVLLLAVGATLGLRPSRTHGGGGV